MTIGVKTRQGNPCKRGHDGTRFVTSRGCVECARERNAGLHCEVVGLTFHGKPCKNGHDGLRYTKAKRCIYCARLTADKVHRADPAAARRMGAEWRAANREKLALDKARYALENPEKIRAGNRNAKARRRNAEGRHTAENIEQIRREQGDCCFYCRDPLFGAGHVDHFIALANGGSNWPENLCLTDSGCNLSKGAKDPLQWISEQEFAGIVIEVCDDRLVPCRAALITVAGRADDPRTITLPCKGGK